MFQRALANKLRSVSQRMPIVTLVGPRQSGKTTLVRHLFPDHVYVSLEPTDVRALAREDPRGFLAQIGGRSVILDEVDLGDRLVPVEVKSGLTAAPDALDGLRWWTALPGNPNRAGVLVYGGVEARVVGDIAVLPWYLH